VILMTGAIKKFTSSQGSRSVSDVNGFLKRADVPKYFDLLDAAKVRTKPDTVYCSRIAAMEQGYAGLKTIFADRTPTGMWIKAGGKAEDQELTQPEPSKWAQLAW